jgi:hypothetical protein
MDFDRLADFQTANKANIATAAMSTTQATLPRTVALPFISMFDSFLT